MRRIPDSLIAISLFAFAVGLASCGNGDGDGSDGPNCETACSNAANLCDGTDGTIVVDKEQCIDDCEQLGFTQPRIACITEAASCSEARACEDVPPDVGTDADNGDNDAGNNDANDDDAGVDATP